MKNYILFVLFLTFHFSFSQKTKEQKIDSLKTELSHAKEDTTKTKILNKLSDLHYYIDIKKTFQYAKTALILSKKLDYKDGIAYSYDNLGIYYWLKSDFPLALDYTFKALNINEKRNNKKAIAASNNSLGIIYIEYKKYDLALNFLNKALKISQELNDKKSTAVYLNNIGDVYLKQNEYNKALHYFNQAIHLNIIAKNSFETGLNYTNIGIVYNFLKQYTKSIEAINKSALIYKNDSSLFNGFNKIEFGKSYYYLALEEKNKKNKAQLLQKSLDYINESMFIFKKEESLINISEAYLYLSKINKEQGNNKLALENFEKSTYLNDSIFSNENKTQIQFLESQREIELRDNKIEIQNLKINSEARKVYLLITITVAVAILLGLFFWLYLSKRKTNLQLEDKNKIISNINNQKDKFFSIIAHDLRGPFNGFLGLTELLVEDLESMNPTEIQFAAESMKNSATNLHRLLENLLEWSKMEQGLIPFNPKENVLYTIISECVVTFQDSANKKQIKISIDIPENATVFADTNILNALIRNLLSNAIKFTSKGGSVSIQSQVNDKNTIISIIDSGIGMNAKMKENLFRLDVQSNRKGTEDELSTGLGLILCKEFIEKHGGEIWVESEEGKGSTFSVSLPNKKSKI